MKYTYAYYLTTKQHNYYFVYTAIIVCLILSALYSIWFPFIPIEKNADARSLNFTEHNIDVTRIQDGLSNRSNPCGKDPRDLSCIPLCNPWEPGCSVELQSNTTISEHIKP
jgi:hypothetical protein